MKKTFKAAKAELTVSSGRKPASTKNKPSAKKKIPDTSFPIVGIGASAGGLEALEAFFTAMPPDSGIAFVVVTHLDPSHASIMPELMQRRTAMQVQQVTDNMKIRPNQVYIIPPNREMAVLHGSLQLLEMRLPRGANLPIDTFFRSLAEDQRANAVCIILSGTGTDGTLGLRAVKGEAGMAMVQTPDSAKYDGMPRSAITTGLVDYVLPPNEMPAQLLRYVAHASQNLPAPECVKDDSFHTALQKIFVLLRTRAGHDFSQYKKNTITRRIERRMHVHQIDTVELYIRYLQESEQEILVLFRELLIGVTSFFRDPEAFDLLRDKYLPELLKDKPENSTVRIWVSGCSSGEEAYSIAIVLQEFMAASQRFYDVQIFGTDIDAEAIEKARKGFFPESIAADIDPKRLKNFFTRIEHQYQVKKVIREMVVFATQSLIKDPPFTRLDLVCCRNILIYFESVLQQRLLPVFHYSLKPEGLLFLGSSETIGQATDLFSVKDRKWKIFMRRPVGMAAGPVIDPLFQKTEVKMSEKENLPVPPRKIRGVDPLQLLKSILSQSDLPTCVIIDDRADIIYIHGRTGRFLEPAEGAASINILEMARPGLKAGLTAAIRKLNTERQETTVKNIKIRDNGGNFHLNLVVRPLPDLQTGHSGLMMVIFEEVVPAKSTAAGKPVPARRQKNSDAIMILEEDLQYTRENLQATIEEMETANEELKSSNEELQSTNEELQSTNEELETSKEEMQSLNEESVTVNAELQSRIDELSVANDDLKNLLDATEIAAIFIDIDLGVRLFTPMATKLVPLTLHDKGRPISHFSTRLHDVNLSQHATAVLNDLVIRDVEVRGLDGNIYRMRVRPYRTVNNLIDGVVFTFEDITTLKKSKVFLEGMDPIIIEDLNGIIIDANNEALSEFGYDREELLGKSAKILIPPEQLHQTDAMRSKCQKGKVVRSVEGLRLDKSGRAIPVLLTLSMLTDLQGNANSIASIMKNISGLKASEEELRSSLDRYRTVCENTEDIISRFDRECRHVFINGAVSLITGLQPEVFLGKTHRQLAFPPALCDYFESNISQVFKEGQSVRDEFDFDAINGTIHVHLLLTPEHDEKGNVTSVLSNMRYQAKDKAPLVPGA